MSRSNFSAQISAIKRMPLYVRIAVLLSIIILTGTIFFLSSNSVPARPAAAEITTIASATSWLETPTAAPLVITPTYTPPNIITPTITAAISRYEVAQTFAPLVALPTTIDTPLTGVLIIQENDNRGDFLTVVASEGGYNYKIGPLAEGIYAVGPNDKFLVYITNNAVVYAAKIGVRTLTEVGRLTKEFPAVKEGSSIFDLSFHYNGYAYILVIHEVKYNGNNSVVLPRSITH